MAKTWLRVDENGLLAESVECISCGADLTGASPSARCPKCREIVLDSLAGMGLAQVDEQGRLVEDIACGVCRYNLRTQLPDGQCPECGAEVAPALEGMPIRYFGLKWLTRMSQGSLLYFIAGIVGPILGMSAGILQLVTQDPAILATYGMGVSLLAMAIGIPGLWFLTAAPPHHVIMASEGEVGRATRQAARIIGIFGYLMGTFQAVTSVLYPATAAIGGLAAMPVGAIAFATLFIHLSRTARAIPDEGLAKHSRIVTWLMVVGIAFAFVGLSTVTASMVLAGIPLDAMQNVGSDPAAGEKLRPVLLFVLAGGALSALGGLAALGCTVYSLVIVFLFRRRFAAAAKMIPIEGADEGD